MKCKQYYNVEFQCHHNDNPHDDFYTEHIECGNMNDVIRVLNMFKPRKNYEAMKIEINQGVKFV